MSEPLRWRLLSITSVGAILGVVGAIAAYSALDSDHVAWLLLRTVSDFPYSQHGWYPARNFRFWQTVLIGLATGGAYGAARAKGSRHPNWGSAAAGFLGRLLIPLGSFVVE